MKITRHFLSGVIIACCFSATAQNDPAFYQTYYRGPQWDMGQSVCPTKDGGYIISGRTNNFGNGMEDAYIVKTNASGDTLWTKALGGTQDDYGYTIRVAPDGGYLVSGHTASFGHGDCDGWMFKLDSMGTLVWMNTYGTPMSEVTYSFNFTNDNGYVLVGFHGSDGDTTGGVYLVKTDVNGDTAWTKYFYQNVSSAGSYVCQTSDSGYVFTGYTANYAGGKKDILLGKTDKLGNLRWLKTFGGDSDDDANCLQITPDGGYIIAGYTNSYGAGNDDGYVIRTNSMGDTLWTKTYGGTNLDRFSYIASSGDGGYILTGMTKSFGAGGSDVYVVKIDGSGNQQWMKTYGDTADQVSGTIKLCADSGFIIAGSNSTNANITGVYDLLLIKIDKNGNMITGINNPQSGIQKLSAYPNPFTNFTTIVFNENGEHRLEVDDVTGRKQSLIVCQGTQYELPANGLAPGVYFIKVSDSGQSQISTIKLVVQ